MTQKERKRQNKKEVRKRLNALMRELEQNKGNTTEETFRLIWRVKSLNRADPSGEIRKTIIDSETLERINEKIRIFS